MVGLFTFFSDLKRLLAISPTSRLDYDTTPPPISASLPQTPSRDPHLYPNGIFHPPPLQRQVPAYSPYPIYSASHIPSLYSLGHPNSVSHRSFASLTRPHAPTSHSPESSSSLFQASSPTRSDGNVHINIPPPAYSEDRLPTYSYSGSVAGPSRQVRGAEHGSILEFVYLQRFRIGPVAGPMQVHISDPSQNRDPRAYAQGRPLRQDMYRGTLFQRVMPAKRNLWLPAIIISAVVGVYVLVKVGGKGKDTHR